MKKTIPVGIASGTSVTSALKIEGFNSVFASLPTLSTVLNTAIASVQVGVFNSTTSSWTKLGNLISPASGATAVGPWVLSSTVGGFLVNLAPAIGLNTIRLEFGGTNSTAVSDSYVYFHVASGYDN